MIAFDECSEEEGMMMMIMVMVAFSLVFQDFGRMFDSLFPPLPFFFFFNGD